MPRAIDILDDAAARLRDMGVTNSVSEAKWLMEAVIGVGFVPEKVLSAKELATYEGFIKRRLTGEPYAHIVGEMEFWSLPFKVTKDTLIPRPDSETLISFALDKIRKENTQTILDLGTGSGCLLLSLLSEVDGLIGVGVDKSAGAVAVAQENAERLGLKDRAAIRESNWFTDVADRFGMIISNPPYIKSSVMPTLMTGVKDFEPHGALDGGKDGLDAYRHIISRAPDYLTTDGWLVMEIGFDQAREVSILMRERGALEVHIMKDLADNDRVVAGKFNK